MNKYKLDKFPTSFYTKQFIKEKITIVNIPGEAAQACITILYGEENMDFDIYFPVEDGKLSPTYIQLAEEVLSLLPLLDDQARKLESPVDYEEHLAYVIIQPSEIRLHYFASNVNTEWGAYFKKADDNSWQFTGLG